MKKENVETIRYITPNDVKIYTKIRRYFTPKAKEVFNFFIENCSDYIHNKEHVSEPTYWDFRLDENWFIVTYVDECDPYNDENEIEILMENMYNEEKWKEYLLKYYK